MKSAIPQRPDRTTDVHIGPGLPERCLGLNRIDLLLCPTGMGRSICGV
ncbi:hypothetical protein os1_22520 [Comamonadaceae bacterium OS-1]|nr:hypothetical protein os1_22520 [Comamonadaceae bacterium OS-1]